MRRKWITHITAVIILIGFVVLGLGSTATTNTISFSGMGATGTVPANQRAKPDTEIILPGGEGLSLGNAVFSGWVSCM